MPTIIEQLSEAQAKISELDKAFAAATAKADADAQAVKSATDALAVAQAETKAQAEAHAKVVADKDSAIKAEQAAHAETKEKLAKAEKALANPAFLDAAAAGSKQPVPEGGVPVTQAVLSMTSEQAHAKYRKIEDPVARTAFRKEHWKLLGIQKEE